MNPAGINHPRLSDEETREMLMRGLLDAAEHHNLGLSREECAALAGDLVPTANEIVRRRRPVTRSRNHNRDTVQRQARLNAETVDKAERAWQPWTGPELELAARANLTAQEVAAMIGRSFYAVKTMRKRLLVDPKKQRLAHGGNPTP